jgi:hypothetical protein
MSKLNFKAFLFPAFMIAITLSSCQAIGDIFKTGVGVGIAIVVVIVIIIFAVIGRSKK